METVWPEDSTPEPIKAWVHQFFAAADSKGEESARKFAELFQSDGTMIGMGPPLHGKHAIYEARLSAWDTVEHRKHSVFKVYRLKRDFSDIMLLGNLDSTLKNGNSYSMEFAAQVLFANSQSEQPEASSYKVWADKRIAIDAAKG